MALPVKANRRNVRGDIDALSSYFGGGGFGSAPPAEDVYVLRDGTKPLTAEWDAGSFKIIAQRFESDIISGTAPLIVASTTLVSNLNADLLDGYHAAAFALAGAWGTGTAGRIAQWAAGGATLEDSTLIKSGAGVLTLSAGGAYTLTVPATGTATLGTGAQYNVALWSGANTVKHLGALGTAAQYLRSAGAAADPAWATIAASEIGSGAALTRVDDTNVTLTLGGGHAAALLSATSLTLGWSGQLAPGRGGTGVNNAGTFTNATNSSITGGGTLALAGFTLTIPATGTAVLTSRTLTSGAGLTGGGDLSADRTFAVGAGALITVGADIVGISVGTAADQIIATGATPFTPAYRLISTLAGAGLICASGVLAVGAGTLITVAADSAGITPGAADYGYIGSSTTPWTATWRSISTLAGAGLTHTAGVLAVGAGSGVTVNADDVALTWGTPTIDTIQPDDAANAGASTNPARSDHTHGIVAAAASTLTVSTTNAEGNATSFARSNHIHTITSSSNPGAAAQILASTAAGYLELEGLGVGATALAQELRVDGNLVFVGAQSITTTIDGLTLAPAANLLLDPVGNSVLLGIDVGIETNNWVSGLNGAGWGIAYTGAGDFRSIYAEEIRTHAFIAEIYSAMAGALIITQSRAKVSRDFDIPDTGESATLYVEDLEGFEDYQAFTANDYVLLRVMTHGTDGQGLTVIDVYGTVSGYSNLAEGEQSWTFTTTTHGIWHSRTLTTEGGDVLTTEDGNALTTEWTLAATTQYTIYAGSIVLDYGQVSSGSRGIWAATVLDSAGSPYSQVQTWSAITDGEPSSFTTHVRLGNLDGLAGVDLEYGLYAGQGLTDADAFLLITDSQVELHNLPFEVHDGVNTVYKVDPTVPSYALGSSVPTGFAAGTGVWAGLDSGVYKWRVGDPSGVRMSWDNTKLDIGDPSNENVYITSTAVQIRNGATVYTDLTGGVLTLGNTAAEYVKVSTAGTQIYDGASLYATYGATTTIGLTAGEHISISATAIQLKDGATALTDISGGNITVGQVAVSQSNVYIAAGAIALRNNTTTRISLAADGSGYLASTNISWTTAGVLTAAGWVVGATSLADAAGVVGMSSAVTAGDDIRFWAGHATPASAPFRVTEAGALTATSATVSGAITANTGTLVNLAVTGKLTMEGANSAIAIGTTAPTSATVGTGIWLDRTGLYSLAADVLQVKIDAVTGALTGGAGAVQLGATGLKLTAPTGTDTTTYVKWVPDAYSASAAFIKGTYDAGTKTGTLSAIAQGVDTGGDAQVIIGAWPYGANHMNVTLTNVPTYGQVRIGAATTGGSLVLNVEDHDGVDRFYVYDDGDVRIGGGLYVGSIGTDPAAGWIYADGGMYIGDTANAKQTLGLTINQGTADDEILALKSSDVAHGMTTYAETDTYGVLQKSEATSGGLSIRGFKDADGAAGYALSLSGFLGEAADTTKSTNAIGVVTIAAYVKSGTGIDAVGADGNLVVIRNMGTARFIFDAEGSAHADVEWIAFDEYDDVALLADLESAMLAQRDPIKAQFIDFLRYNQVALEETGLVHFDRDNPGHAMVNTTKLSMALVGALKQLGARLDTLEQKQLHSLMIGE